MFTNLTYIFFDFAYHQWELAKQRKNVQLVSRNVCPVCKSIMIGDYKNNYHKYTCTQCCLVYEYQDNDYMVRKLEKPLDNIN